MSNHTILSLRLPNKLHATMKRIAKANDRSLTSLIRKACVELVERNRDGK